MAWHETGDNDDNDESTNDIVEPRSAIERTK